MILRANLWLLALLLLMAQQGRQLAMAEDYADEGRAQDNANQGSGDDIYEPAQQEDAVQNQAKQINSLEEESALPAQTDNSLSMEQQPQSTTARTNATTTEEPAQDSEENTAEEEIDDEPTKKEEKKAEQPSKHSNEYYYDMHEEEEEQSETSTTTSTTQQPTTKPTTTMIPEYVRKAKAERVPAKPMAAPAVEQDSSDYVEEESEPAVEQQTQKAKPASAEEDMQLDEQPVEPQAQVQQQLPDSNKPKPFKSKASFDEYYYDDQAESGEAKPASTTAAPTIATTRTTTSAPEPVKPLLQGRFGFLWPSSSSTTTSPTTLTPIASTVATTPRKQSKHIHVPSPKPELQPADQLRNYIKDVYIRMPLAVIVDPSSASLEKAKKLYIDALQDKNINIKIVLVTLNAAGAPAAFSFNNTREFIAGLNSTKEHEGGNAFVGVLHAAELVPYDSAVFISTAIIPPHTELVQDAAITLLKKRIRLFLLWYGERSASENETEEAVGGILGEVAIRSGGEIIHIVSTEHGQHIAGNTLTLVADAYEGAQELPVPVDTTLSSLHVKIDAPMRRATLETPNGEIILKKLVKFKPRNQLTVNGTKADSDELDAYVPLNKLRKATNYTLKLSPEQPNKKYNVFIRGERKADVFLGDIIKRFDSYFLNGQDRYPTRLSDTRSPGALSHAKLQFPEAKEELSSPKSEVETFSDSEVHREADPSPSNQTEFAAATASDQRSSLNGMLQQRCGTKIELSTQSQLLVTPGQMATLLFEVTNMRSERVYQNVQVTDERRFLVQLTPSSFYLNARQTTTVRLTVLVPAGTAQGTSDRITFSSYGREPATLAVNLKVVSSIDAQDNTGPSMSWEFGNRCDYVPADSLNCGERFWTLDITAQDWQSGIMRLQTTPAEGLFYRNYATLGTTEPLKASYMASCCEPKVTIAAYDAAGNQRSISLDVRDVVLTEGAIAAIALAAILILLIIALIIASIVWCCKRRKVSLELPTYRSHSTRSMN